MRYRVLGGVGAEDDGSPVDLSPQQRRILAALLLSTGAMSVDRLLEVAYGESPPGGGHRSLHTAVSRLRSALGAGSIVTEGAGYRLAAGDDDVDARRFEHALGRARKLQDSGRSDDSLATLDVALAQWAGRAYGELADEHWAAPEAHRLEELRLAAIEERAGLRLDLGAHAEVVAELVQVCTDHPLRERVHRLAVLALHRSGRQAEALRLVDGHRRALVAAGLEPSPAMLALETGVARRSPELDGSPVPGLRGYRLGPQLGEGAFAVVYRGTQPSVGREVAVKVIRAELANRPEFVRCFEAEAHVVARLEHPYIVPLYDYWREPGRACLVFRYLRGGTLASALTAGGRLPLDRCSALVDQIGAALGVAHAAGVVHRDVKPANVFLDDAGNFFLGDFGIALAAAQLSDPSAALSAGSPAYASPEQLRRLPIGPAADVHGLGISLFEALTGRLPFPTARTEAELLRRQLQEPIPRVRDVRDDVPAAVDDVLFRATAKEPDDRFQSVEEMVEAFRAALARPLVAGARAGAATALAIEDARNPYKGLRAFTEADAADFHGRDRLVDRLVEVLSRTGTPGRIAMVVGPSGIGKSSVVRAGLLPALRIGAVAGSDRWFIATMMPGAEPFEELAAALLRVATHVPENLMGQLSEDQRGVARVVKALLPEDDDGEILLVIDQFEELFTLVEDPADTRRFLDALEHALVDARCPLRVVLTLRADLWDRPLRHGAFARLIDASTVHVTALAPDELDRAIVDPAVRVGADFEPGLVSEIVADVTDQPGGLPLLQYALTELWERRVSGLMTRDAYRALGGVAGALARRAEELYAESSAAEQAATRRAFGRLVAVDEGGGARASRRRARLAEVATTREAVALIDRYRAARLLSADIDPVTREPTIEIAHEALLRQWPRLGDWLDEDRDSLRILRHLHRAAEEWDVRGRPDTELYRGARLEAARAWAGEAAEDLTETESAFVAASVRRSAEDADAAQRSARRLRRLLVGVVAVAVIALVAGATAFEQRRHAERNADAALAARAVAEEAAAGERQARDDADIRRMVSDAAALVDEDPALALLVAATAHAEAPGVDTLGAMQRALVRTDGLLGFLGTGTSYGDMAFTDDGRLVARAEDAVEVWDLATRRVLHRVPVAGPGHLVLAGGLAVTSVPGGAIRRIDVDRGALLGDGPAAAEVTELSASADGALVAVGRVDGQIEVFDSRSDASAGAARPVTRLASRVGMLLLARDGQSVFTADRASGDARRVALDGGADIWMSTFASRIAFAGYPPSNAGTEYGRARHDVDGRGIFTTALFGGTMRLDAETGAPTHYWPIDKDQAIDAIALPDGRLLTGTGAIDRSARHAVDRYRAAEGNSTGVAVSLAGDVAAVASGNGIVLWSTSGDQLLAHGFPLHGASQASLDPAGRHVASARLPSVDYHVWDIGSGRAVERSIPGAQELFWVPSGELVSAGYAAPTQLWDVTGTTPAGAPLAPMGWGSYNIDARRGLAVVGGLAPFSGQILGFDLKSGERARQIADPFGLVAEGREPAETWVTQVAFSPDGSLMAATSWAGRAALFDASTWDLLAPIEVAGGEPVANLTFSHNGAVLAVQTAGGTIHVLDIGTQQPVGEPLDGEPATTGFGHQHPLTFGPDDATLVVGLEGGVQLWDLARRQPIGGVFPNDGLAVASVRADGHAAATAVDDRLLVWDLDTSAWPELACRAAGRNLTAAEWAQYGPSGRPYRATCSQWPSPV